MRSTLFSGGQDPKIVKMQQQGWRSQLVRPSSNLNQEQSSATEICGHDVVVIAASPHFHSCAWTWPPERPEVPVLLGLLESAAVLTLRPAAEPAQPWPTTLPASSAQRRTA